MPEQIQEITEQPVQQEVVPEIPPKKNFLRIVLLVILGLLVAGGLVYAGMNLGKKQSPPEVIPQVTEPTPTPDETADWETYTNSEYGYSIKYPLTWKVTREESNKKAFENLVQFDPPTYKSFTSFIVTVLPKTYEEEISELRRITQQYGGKEEKAFVGFNKVEAYKFTFLTGIADSDYNIILVFKNNNHVFEISPLINNPPDPNEIAIFDQILSTFKFLTPKTEETIPSSSPTPSLRKISYRYIPGWPLYKALLDFDFQYPPDYSSPEKNIVDFLNGQFYCAFYSAKRVGTGSDELSFIAIPKNYEDKIQKTLRIVNAPGYLAKEDVQIYSYPAVLLELDQSYKYFKKDQALIIETDTMLLILRYHQNEINNNWNYILESIKIGSNFNEKYFQQNMNSCRS